MNEDELKKLWRQQPVRTPDVPPAELISALQKRTTQLRRGLLTRDAGEIVACAVVILIFGIFYFTLSRTPLSRLGDLIIIGSSIFIAWKLIHTRRSHPPAPPDATVVESLRAELNAVRAQSRLLGSIFWWYLLPLGIGIFVFTGGNLGGGLGALVFQIIYALAVIALYTWIYRLNQRARTSQLLPIEAQLESLIRSVETGEPLDENHVAGLRPLVLSMQAADHAKPVEFKVAFWQLAIYGVPGIVGIWFFLTLALTMSDNSWKIQSPPATMAASAAGAGETNRYSVVARKLVDLFNTGDYVALQNLYGPGMAARFPLEETSKFYRGIASSFGKIEKLEGPVGQGYQGWPAFTLRCQRGAMTMSLALDADDSISGIYFKPATSRYAVVPNIQPFLRRFFSGPHLLWGALSFIGGLIYTWLIQKTVKCAVGISAAGIHLQNGTKLILWDEIEEVRPYKFLNIRNLTLIQESGEKTRMHWTPLERHSDVQAAVEKFAPPNHPIRSHLSLLRTGRSQGTS